MMLDFLEKQIDRFIEYLSDKYFDKPGASSMDGWRKWKLKTKKEKPIAYFVIEEYLFVVANLIGKIIKNPFYNIRSKYFKKQNIVKIDVQRFVTNQNSYEKYRLEDYHYSDPPWLMLYANFQLLVDYVEQEAHMIDWSGNPEHTHAWKEMTELYIWWTKTRFEDENNNKFIEPSDFDLTRGQVALHNSGSLEDDELIKKCKEYDDALNKWHITYGTYELVEQEMLERLIKIRNYLWS